MWKVGGIEMWFTGEMDHRCCGVEGALVVEKGERDRSTWENAQREYFPKPLAWKMKGAEFCEFLQPAGLKVWSFKGQWVWLG